MALTRRGNWLLLLLLATLAVAVVLVPVFLLRPFAPQTPRSLALSFGLRRWSPVLTLFAAVAALLLVWRLWRARPRLLARVATVLILALVLGSAWLARQNHFEWMFIPLPDARFVRAANADFVAGEDLVLAVTIGGDATAYPIRQLAYHHLVEDAVGRVPIVATY
jgi:uncharacterized protein DUF3179